MEWEYFVIGNDTEPINGIVLFKLNPSIYKDQNIIIS